MTDTNVDLVVLGGGSGGYAAALRAAELGSSVVLIEKEKVGGTCLHWGCVPAKTLLHAAEVADEAREGLSIGVKTTFDGVDVPALLKYKDGIINRLYKGLTGLVKSRGITTVEGEGKFVGPNTVVVGGDRYIGKDVILATGSYSRTLPGLTIEGRVITSTQALSLEWIPEKAIVLGGGVIGVEFASTWASFGTEVTIVEALPTLVPLEDPWAAKLLERAFRKRKIAFKTGVRFQGVTQDDSGVTVTLEDGTTLHRRSAARRGRPRARTPPAAATKRPASPWTAASSSPTSGCTPTCRMSTRSATSCPACSWRTAASSRASSSPRRSPA